MNNKILLTSGIYPPDVGGPATFIPEFCKFLVKKGFLFEVVTLRNAIIFPISKKENIFFVNRRINRILRVFITAILIAKKLVGKDSVFSNGLYEETSLANFFLRKNSVAKVVGNPIWERYRNDTGSRVPIDTFDTLQVSIKYRLERRFFIWSLNRFDVITCPSNQLKELMSRWGVKTPIYVVPNGVNCKTILTNEKEYDVVSTSRLVSWKNIDKLIEACVSNNLKLAICGNGPEIKHLRDKVESLDASQMIHFKGDLEARELEDILGRSKVFALISDYEGLSYGLIEAMHLGLTIVVSNNSGNKDVITDSYNGIIVPLPLSDELGSTLVRACREVFTEGRMSTNAHKDAQTFYCAEKQMSKIADLFKK